MILLIYLLAALDLPLQAEAINFERRPGITCGVQGRAAHMVWNYDDSVIELRWYYGTEATGTVMGAYVPSTSSFAAFGSYAGNISFTSPVYTAGYNGAKLTFVELRASDAGNYTTVFKASPGTFDISVLEVAEPDGLGTWEICVDGKCDAISDSLTLSASDSVKVQFTKNSALMCDMVIDVTPSVGPICHMKVGARDNLTAECDLADAVALVAAKSLSIYLAFGKNGEVFYNRTIAVSVMPDTPGSPNTWNDLYVIPIVLGVCILVIIIVVVVVVRRRKKMETGRPHPQDRNSGVSVGVSAAGMPPGGQPKHKAQPNPQSGAPSGDMAYKVGYVDPDAPALYHDDRYESGFGNTGYSH